MLAFLNVKIAIARVRPQFSDFVDEAWRVVVRLLPYPRFDAVHVLARGFAELASLLRNGAVRGRSGDSA